MNRALLEAAMKRAEAELSGLQFGEVNLCLEVRDGKINRIETTRVKSCLARDLAATDEGAHYGSNTHRN